ncbi:MAG TPA: hypothetical protein VG650_13755 [Mycobacteriales bacterium]|nr:hypothetical protein [Mycobacteriales bacterium]
MRRTATAAALAMFALMATGPARGAVTPDEQWQVPAPALLPFSTGHPVTGWPNCHVADIHAAAHTLRSTYGVLGAVRLRGSHCLIRVTKPIVALLDADRHVLDVPIRTAAAKNRGNNPQAQGATNAISWGFAWRGSWCGAQAVYLRVGLSGGRLLRIPLPGGKPACTNNKSHSVVIRGSFGAPGEAVQAAPSEWSSLSAKLHANPTVTGSTLRGLSVTLTNRSPDPVSLDPCPHYAIEISSTHGAAVPDGHPGRTLAGCPGTETVVPAKGSRTIHLDPVTLNRKDFGPPGTKVSVTFGMAGLAPSAVRSRLA